jgi:hypothetical protein
MSAQTIPPELAMTPLQAEETRDLLIRLYNRARLVADAGERITEVPHPLDREAAMEALHRTAVFLGEELQEILVKAEEADVVRFDRAGVAS